MSYLGLTVIEVICYGLRKRVLGFGQVPKRTFNVLNDHQFSIDDMIGLLYKSQPRLP